MSLRLSYEYSHVVEYVIQFKKQIVRRMAPWGGRGGGLKNTLCVLYHDKHHCSFVVINVSKI